MCKLIKAQIAKLAEDTLFACQLKLTNFGQIKFFTMGWKEYYIHEN